MLRLYHDAECLQEITKDDNPDIIKDAVFAGGTMTNIVELYVKSDDATSTYENVYVTGIGDEDGATKSGEVDITYSLNGTNYLQELPLPDGDYVEAIKIYRKAVAPAVAKRFKRLEIEHELGQDEYAK